MPNIPCSSTYGWGSTFPCPVFIVMYSNLSSSTSTRQLPVSPYPPTSPWHSSSPRPKHLGSSVRPLVRRRCCWGSCRDFRRRESRRWRACRCCFGSRGFRGSAAWNLRMCLGGVKGWGFLDGEGRGGNVLGLWRLALWPPMKFPGLTILMGVDVSGEESGGFGLVWFDCEVGVVRLWRCWWGSREARWRYFIHAVQPKTRSSSSYPHFLFPSSTSLIDISTWGKTSDRTSLSTHLCCDVSTPPLTSTRYARNWSC